LDEWIKFLESKGYSNYWKDLNAKNFGIPQNRNRTFMVSILGDYTYEFPKEFPLELRLKDMLEDSVDEKFYLSDKMINFFTENTKKQQEKGNGFKFKPTDGSGIGKAVTTRAGGRMDDNFIEEPQERFFKQALETVAKNDCSVGDTVDAFNKRVNKSGVSPTVTTRPEGFKTAILPVVNVVGNYSPSGHDASRVVDTEGLAPTVKENHGTVTAICEPLAYDEQNGYIRKDGTVGTLTTDGSSPKHNNRVIENCYVSEKGVRYILDAKRGMATDVNAQISQPLTAKGQSNWTGSFISPDIESLEKSSTIGSTEPTKINLKNGETITSNDNLSKLRIRKLTPKECWRLMGFDDADFEKASQYNSNSQLYKQAGNSIVVDVLYYIFRQMI
jgi:DNA (cytosine-5)-methyltransferase 1